MNTRDSWEVVKISTFTGVWRQLTATLREDSEGFKTSGKEVTAEGEERAGERASGAEPEDGTDGLQPHDGTERMKRPLMEAQGKWFRRWNVLLLEMP